MNPLRVGLIGLGNVAEVHLHAYQSVDQVSVVAGAEMRKERLIQMAEAWDITGYVSYEEMLEKEDLDIACVLTPTATHREITERVAAQGARTVRKAHGAADRGCPSHDRYVRQRRGQVRLWRQLSASAHLSKSPGADCVR